MKQHKAFEAISEILTLTFFKEDMPDQLTRQK